MKWRQRQQQQLLEFFANGCNFILIAVTFGAPKRVTLARNPSRAFVNLPRAAKIAKVGSAERLLAKVKANLQTGTSGRKDGILALLQADPQDRMLPRPVSLCTITKHPHHNSSHRAHMHAKINTYSSSEKKERRTVQSFTVIQGSICKTTKTGAAFTKQYKVACPSCGRPGE